MAKKKQIKKKKFINMEITRVKMNPEQAVLSCCDATQRDGVDAPSQCIYSRCVNDLNTSISS